MTSALAFFLGGLAGILIGYAVYWAVNFKGKDVKRDILGRTKKAQIIHKIDPLEDILS